MSGQLITLRDKVSIPRVEGLHPLVRESAFRCIIKAEAGLPLSLAIRVTQGTRTIAEQDALYAQGRTRKGKIVTNAKGGSSYHNYGLALDFAILLDKNGDGKYDELSWDIKKDIDRDGIADWLEAVKIFEADGWEWGGKWSSIKDYPHVQKTFGFKWQQLYERHKKGLFLPGTTFVSLAA